MAKRQYVNEEELLAFVRESNGIEGILREPTVAELDATNEFAQIVHLRVSHLCALVEVYAPGARLRDQPGMNVTVGFHRPIAGGPMVTAALQSLLDRINARHTIEPFEAHVEYETIHPFMDGNGRSGRALWLWMMNGCAPLGFLHQFYYQTLQASRPSLEVHWPEEHLSPERCRCASRDCCRLHNAVRSVTDRPLRTR